ncbi:TetR/AcrR family transcriptional regulator [bacterium C-53]|nr:TetR/AcrR family transcriptional regulator [Lachnospiraceae bacterium]NBI03261.1 TetR/AcrR family transcriptional regulator [Lachnospiraceae bacterium]RKJ10142.1 TetR/AcrR family transcriptional regulator [bacterium C-53]
MPPKAKFTRDEIVQTALGIVQENGIESLSARALGARLDSSARPVFTVFQNMEEVQQAVLNAARNKYNEYTRKGLSQTPAFKGAGEQYIQFAKDEPKLFQLLFMSEKFDTMTVDNRLALDNYYERIILSIQTQYGVSRNIANTLYRHLWIYTHGIATLIATKVCIFTDGEIDTMLTEIFIGMLKNMSDEKGA